MCEPSLGFNEREFETVLEDCETNIQNETGHRRPMGMLGLWHPGSLVSHGLFGPRVLCGL